MSNSFYPNTIDDDIKQNDLVFGEQKVNIICPECNTESISLDRFNCLNIPIANKSMVSIIVDIFHPQ